MTVDAPSSNRAVGDVIDGRYLLLRRLGTGGVGSVWQARDLNRDIDVALKMLRSEHVAATGKDDIIRRFEQEGALAERMLSPHIARVLAHGWTDAQGPYMVYEHLDGEDLASVLEQRKRLAIVDVRTVVVHACRGLARAHALGVLHRDVKPANLFVTQTDGRMLVKVLDFGVAETIGHATEGDGQAFVGTPEYMAPEILFGEGQPGARSDLYSLGVVAYECFTGRLPYEGRSIGELVAAFARDAMTPASSLRRSLPEEVDAWIARALDRDPERRFASAKEMADALHEAFESLDVMPPSVAVVGSFRPDTGPPPMFPSTGDLDTDPSSGNAPVVEDEAGDLMDTGDVDDAGETAEPADPAPQG